MIFFTEIKKLKIDLIKCYDMPTLKNCLSGIYQTIISMEIWQLNTFTVVAKTLHFTRASQELNLTQSAVSHQIKSLEEELGVRLFNRDKRKVSLTSKGLLVLEYANKMINQVNVMRREIEENKESLQGTLKLVAVPRSLNSPFYQVKQHFESIYPDIHLYFEAVISSEAVFENIKKGISDIGFTTENEDFRDLLPIPYGSFEMMFVVGKNHRFAGRKEVELKELEDEEWLLFEKGSWLRRKTDEIFAKQNFQPKIISETNDGATVFSLVKDGGGVGFLPKWGILEGLEEEKLIPVKLKGVKSYTPLNIVVLPENHSKLVSLFIDYLLKKQLEGIEIDKKPKSNFSRN